MLVCYTDRIFATIIIIRESYKMKCASTNGRVDIVSADLQTPATFTHSDKLPVNQCVSYRDAMSGNWYDTRLSDAFFSAENIKIIQNGIRAGVHKMSSGAFTIGDQDCDELKIIMRSVFLQYARNMPINIQEQIATLNSQVLDYAVPQVHGEAVGYLKYKHDVSTLATPLQHPILARTNDKQLQLKSWF